MLLPCCMLAVSRPRRRFRCLVSPVYTNPAFYRHMIRALSTCLHLSIDYATRVHSRTKQVHISLPRLRSII